MWAFLILLLPASINTACRPSRATAAEVVICVTPRSCTAWGGADCVVRWYGVCARTPAASLLSAELPYRTR
jgi:hypothetical protein